MFSLRYLASALVLSASLVAPCAASDDLADGFRHPPPDARPQTWWHWMNGNITKEGITADLEAMQRIGVGGAQIFNAAQGEPPGPVKVFSPEWFALVKHAVSEADRLGLTITMHNCAGWSESGGPWVTPPQAMQRVVWSELRVHGPQTLSMPLPAPTLVVANYCGDIAVLAFPATADEHQSIAALAPAISTSTPGVDLRPLLDGNGGAYVALPLPTDTAPEIITLDFRQPKACGSVRLVGREYLSMPVEGEIQTSDDGVAFHTVAALPDLTKGRNHPSILTTFPSTSARFYRIVITKVDARAKALELTAIDFGGERLAHTEERAGFRAAAGMSFLPQTIPASDTIATDGVIDLTSHVKDGRLECQVPSGDWTIVRFCHTPTGQMNAPAPDGGRGWECDKMSRAAVDAHFDALMGKVIAEVGPLAGKTFRAVLADSWEAGSENWTPTFRAEFTQRRGYDPLPYLPVVTGRVVGSVEVSERFLWDYRRTIADLIAENHYAEIARLAHAHGMQFAAEAPGIGMPTIADELQCKGRTDIPMGEFWMDGHNDTKETASAAHIYGDSIAAAEAFTAKPGDANWTKSPFDHKMLGDLQFTIGINQFVFHRYAHQPWLDRVPGMAMGRWGTNFDRTNTWWEQARAWMTYLSRCQFLLQRGLPVADVCYFYGEGAPNTLARREPTLPPGYDYDACNDEVLLHRMSVRDGRIVLPNGVSYAVLLLADSERMTVPVLRKIADLVAAGATVVGGKPERSPSLVDYPRCDEEIRRITADVWGDCDGVKITDHAYGKGHIVWGRPVDDVLAAAHLAPDFAVKGEGKFAAIHRRIGEADVYFVSSQNRVAAAAELTFRSAGRRPELWYPDTGTIVAAGEFSEHDGVTSLPMRFDPAGSVFVVFRAPVNGVDAVAAATRDGIAAVPDIRFVAGDRLAMTTDQSGVYVLNTTAGRKLEAAVSVPAAVALNGPWTLRFPSGWGAPAEIALPTLLSWTERAEEGVKHFSGTATYLTTFTVAPEWLASGKSVQLDLGVVKELAEVSVNGRNLGVLWKPPFRVDVTQAVHPGENSLEVRVTNLWPNRMIGDQALPPSQRHTWSTYEPFTTKSALLQSGLLGPVRLEPAVTTIVQ